MKYGPLSGIFGCGSQRRAVSTDAGLNPRLTCCSRQKLWTSSAAPTSSTSASANSPTTRMLRRRVVRPAALADRAASRITWCRSACDPWIAGASPNRTPVTIDRLAVNASTTPSTPIVEARQARGAQLQQAVHAPDRDQQPERAADGREQHAFGEQLRDEARASRAEGPADRHLALPHGRPREQQVGDVRAGDQQHEADGGEQRHERRPDVADEIIVERNHAQRPAGAGGIVRRILLPHVLGKRIDTLLRRRDAQSGLEPAEAALQQIRAADRLRRNGDASQPAGAHTSRRFVRAPDGGTTPAPRR